MDRWYPLLNFREQCRAIIERLQCDKIIVACSLSHCIWLQCYERPSYWPYTAGGVSLSLPYPYFVPKICNFVTDVGETSWKYNKQRGFGAVFSVYKVTLQIVTKISFCKQSEICKQSVLTGFYRKMTLYTNIFEPNFCNRSCQHLQSDWVTDI